MMYRRSLLGGAGALAGASALPRFAIAQAASARTLKFVPQANVTSLDPIWTTANITRNHAFMVYDQLYGLDENFDPQPQMAEGHVVENDGKLWTITLRRGMKFHDGQPVSAADVVASLQRWMKRSPAGQSLAASLDEISANGDLKVVFKLKRPFPRLVASLAAPVNPIAFIMPERIAKTDAFQQIRETIGSGPFRFKNDEYISGSQIVYERNPDYSPTPHAGKGLTAGPKQVFFDRVEWQVIPDAATSAAALQSGEIDWFEQPPPELQVLLARNRALTVEDMDPLPMPALLRLNHLHPPFNNKKLRQALLAAVSQADYMAAAVGPDPSKYVTDVGVFTPGTPLASHEGLEPLTGPRSFDKAKALMKEAGYNNELMRLLAPTDILVPSAISLVAGDMFGRLGFNMDMVSTDWGTVIQRRASREPLEKGGWSAFLTSFSSFDWFNPAAHSALRGNGTAGWFGWPTVPKLEELRSAWFDADDLATQQKLGQEMQRVAMDEVVFIPVGAYKSTTALKRNLKDRTRGFAIFWNIKRA